MAQFNIEELLKERFQARLALIKVTSEVERLKLIAKIDELTKAIEKIRPKK